MTNCLTYSTETRHEVSTLVELLRYRAQNQSDSTAYTFLQDGETEADKLTYKELNTQARAIAARLQSLDVTGSRRYFRLLAQFPI